MKFRNDIQGLRALAVVFVFLFHLSHNFLPGGFIGVDIFFVISGYLISSIVISKIANDKFNLLDFYDSRIKRIVPAYYFLLIAVWVGFYFIFINADIGKFKLSHFWALVFNSNYYFANVDNYFGVSSNENPLLHTWTLGVEMQFYLILPFILLFIKNRKILISILILITVGLFAYSTKEIMTGNKGGMYFSLLARSPEFFIGVLISLVKIEKNNFVIKNAFPLSLIGFIGLLCSALILTETSPFPGALAILPCLSVGLLLITPTSKLNFFLANKFFVFIGEISYSVYLWHWPIIAFLRYYYSRYDLRVSEMFIVIFSTITLSLFSYYFVEKPFRLKKGLRFYAILGSMFIINVLLIVFVVPIKFKTSQIPLEYIYPSFGMESHSNHFKRVGVYGNIKSNGKQILLLGDSHALTYLPYLDELGKGEKFSFHSITNDRYPSLPGLSDKIIVERDRFITYKKLEPSINSEIGSADVLIISFTGDGKKYKNVIEQLLLNLKPNQKVLFISDFPSLDVNPVRINRSHIKDSSKKHQYKLSYAQYDTEILKLIEENPQSKYVDLSSENHYFSDAPFYKDTLMYYDSNHLNYYGSVNYEKVSGKIFIKYLNWALQGD